MKQVIYLILLCTVSLNAVCQDDSYQFPVTRDSDAWNKMENYQQRWDACQIPDKILKAMSTEGLITTFLNYPLLGDLLVFSTTQRGVNNLRDHFNGLSELLGRSDAKQKLLSRYKQLYKQDVDPSWTNIDIGFHVVKIVSLESLLIQPSVLKIDTGEERKELMRLIYDVYLKKRTDKSYHGTVGLSSTAWLMSRVMKTDGLQLAIEKSNDQFASKVFLEEGLVITLDQIDSIASDANLFIN